MAISVHVHGASGRMGGTVVEAVRAAPDMELCGTSGRSDSLADCLARSRPDVVVEFTVPAVVEHNLRAILEHGAHVVSGTTGLAHSTARELGAEAARRGLGLLLAPNFSVGVILMQRFARQAVRFLRDVEIVELHHEQKLDAPSGTALDTAAQIAAAALAELNPDRPPGASDGPSRGLEHRGVPIHSVRLRGLLAHQEVLFGGPGQLLTIRHDTLDRRAFMPGVLLGIRAISCRKGLVASLGELLEDDTTVP